MVYNIAIFSSPLEIRSLQDFVNYEIYYVSNFKDVTLLNFIPDIIIINTMEFPKKILVEINNYMLDVRKILIVEKLNKYNYLENYEYNISSIISKCSIKEQLNSACIKAIYESNLKNSPSTISLKNDLVYHPKIGILNLKDSQIFLTAIQKRFFDYMLIRENSVVTYDEIINTVWNNKVVSQSSLKNMVSFFNKIYPQLIINHYGVGYGLNFRQIDNELNSKIKYLEILQEFNDKVFNFYIMNKEVIQLALDETLRIFKADRICLCYPINLESKYFFVEFFSFVEKFNPHTKDRIKLEMTPEQKILMEKLLQSEEPIYLNENALAPIIMEEYVFIEQGHHPAKSVLISHLKQKSGKSWAFALHQCSFERHYEDVEIKLFKKISEKILILLEKYMSNEKNKLEYINLEKSLI